MKLFVFISATPKRTFLASTIASSIAGVAIEFFGAPPVSIFIVAFGLAALVLATQDWARRHPDQH